MPTNAFKYLETDSFLVLSLTGNTNSGKVLLRLTDISLSTSRDTDETTTMDNGFVKIYNPTFFNWSISATGVLSSDTGESEFQHPLSGDTKIVNTYNGLELLEVMKTRTTSAHIILKISDSNYQKGKVIITACDISGQSGSKMTYSLELQGSGNLTLATS